MYGDDGEGDFVCLFALKCLNLFFAISKSNFDKI